MTNLQGLNVVIDLSHYNTVTSFSTVKADGIAGIIHKATQVRVGWIQLTLVGNSKPSKPDSGGGAYHFGINADGAAQAQYFLFPS